MNARLLRWLWMSAALLVGLAVLLVALVYLMSWRRLTRVRSYRHRPAGHPHRYRLHRARPTPRARCRQLHPLPRPGSRRAELGEAKPGRHARGDLTRGEGGLRRTFADADWVRGIRHGVHANGTSLLVIPSEAFAFMSKADLAALIAYLKQLPPVDRAMPANALGPLGRALLVAGPLSILVAEKTPAMPYPAAVPSGPTAEYGRYLAGFSGCSVAMGRDYLAATSTARRTLRRPRT